MDMAGTAMPGSLATSLLVPAILLLLRVKAPSRSMVAAWWEEIHASIPCNPPVSCDEGNKVGQAGGEDGGSCCGHHPHDALFHWQLAVL